MNTKSTDPLLQPFKLKGVTFRNRIMSTSHSSGHSDKGMPKETLQRYHEEKAKGGIGLTMFGGSSNVSPDSPNVFGQLNFGTDEVIPHLQQFSKRVHNQGAALMVQITHLGRRGSSNMDPWLPTIAPSMVRETVHRSTPKVMDEHDIKRVIRDYADAAQRCKEGGLDGLETMTAGHLTGQFLSPSTNQRTDKYGGSLENRLRFIREVYEAIRQRVGSDFVVGIRYMIDEQTAGWLTTEEAIQAAQILEADGTIDFFNLIVGRIDTERKLSEQCMPGMEQPLAPFLQVVAEFKKELKLPVFHATRLIDIDTARAAIEHNIVDMVGMTRAQIADPHLANKVMNGQEERIRPCVGSQFCQAVSPTSCIHNPATSNEALLPHIVQAASKSRKIVVVGGGVAGLEAARVSAERGHNVVLFEASDKLGGQINLATKVATRTPLQGIISWRESELKHLGVDIRLNCKADTDTLMAEQADVVIIATGGQPYKANFEGAELCNSTWDVLEKPENFKGEVLIYDGLGQHQAPSCANFLVNQGSKVNFIALDGRLADDMGYAQRVIHRKFFQELAIPTHFDWHIAKVEKSTDKNNSQLKASFVHELTDQTCSFSADYIVIEQGTRPSSHLYDNLRERSINQGVIDLTNLIAGKPQPLQGSSETSFELYQIGDAVSSRAIYAAVYDALRLCMAI